MFLPQHWTAPDVVSAHAWEMPVLIAVSFAHVPSQQKLPPAHCSEVVQGEPSESSVPEPEEVSVVPEPEEVSVVPEPEEVSVVPEPEDVEASVTTLLPQAARASNAPNASRRR
ncbi:hypothetical protein ACMHYB_06685 [Sorangium sp. So ce1128]